MTSKHFLLFLLLLCLPNTVCAVTKYVVKKGDNLYNLSKKFGVSVDELKKANGLADNRLDIGNILSIPYASKASVEQKEYVVVKGDTLSQIGARFGVSSEDIKKANKLNSTRLRIGQKLAIPSSNSSNITKLEIKKGEVSSKQKEPLQTKSGSYSISTKYTVKKGDTLGAIANEFGMSVGELKNANGLTDDRLRVGKILTIPSSDSDERAAQRASAKPVQTGGKYFVRRGDNLYDLSRKFGVSVKSIKEVNGLSNDRLNIGDVLLIPGFKNEEVETAISSEQYRQDTTANRIEYVVVKGDTLSGIGSKFGVSVGDIKKANNLKSNNLKIGQRLIIHSSSKPGSIVADVKKVDSVQTITEEKKLAEAASIPTPVSIKYTVKKGDTLSEIANNFGISMRDLKNVNRLSNDNLKVGKVLIIPGSVNTDVARKMNIETVITDKRYTVRKGDSLSSISKKFVVSIESIKRANGLKSNTLYAGDVLLIPNSNRQEEVTHYQSRYVVVKGDTLSGIGDKFRVSVGELKRANGINGNKIRVGQVLAIPGQEQYKTELTKPYSDVYSNNHSYNGNNDGNYSSRKSIISVAKKFLGAPYKFGGNSPVKGLDCSAFVNKVFDFFDVDLPRTARDIYKVGQSVNKDELTTGDLVFFRTYASYPSHVGIYIGDTEFIHASSKAKRVTIDSMDLPYYRKRYIGAKRIELSGLFYDEMSKDYKGFESQ